MKENPWDKFDRYEAGQGPWSKKGPLDEVDLEYFESVSDGFAHDATERGLLASCVERLVQEVRLFQRNKARDERIKFLNAVPRVWDR